MSVRSSDHQRAVDHTSDARGPGLEANSEFLNNFSQTLFIKETISHFVTETLFIWWLFCQEKRGKASENQPQTEELKEPRACEGNILCFVRNLNKLQHFTCLGSFICDYCFKNDCFHKNKPVLRLLLWCWFRPVHLQ